MIIRKFSLLIRIITIAILSGCTVYAFSQNSMFFYVGTNRTLLNSNNKNGIVRTTGDFGLVGAIGVERSFKDNSLSLELSFSPQNFKMIIGPLFFPDDPPTSIGSFYNINYKNKTVNIMPSFNCSLINEKLYIPIGIGIQKTFSSLETELVSPNHTATDEGVEFYQIPDFNISMNSGLNYTFYTSKKMDFYLSLKYSYSLIPIKPLFQGDKKINSSMLLVSTGLKI